MYLVAGETWIDQHNWVPGAAIGVVSIVAAVIIAMKSRLKSTLDYAILTETRVITAKASKLNSDIAVIVNGNRVSKPRFVTIRYKNTGRKEITRKDFGDGVTLGAIAGVVVRRAAR